MDLVGVQEVRWKGNGTLNRAIILIYVECSSDHRLGIELLFMANYVSSGIYQWPCSCITLKGR